MQRYTLLYILSSVFYTFLYFFLTMYVYNGLKMYNIAYMNGWQIFLEQLLRDFRISQNMLAIKSGITQPTINRIVSGQTEKPNPETIRRLEECLEVRIDDSDLKNITYTRIKEEKEEGIDGKIKVYKIPLLSNVYAGEPAMMYQATNIEEYVHFDYPFKENLFALRVNGDSMKGRIYDGDKVLVDPDAEIIDNCIVVVRLRNGEQFIKRFQKLSEQEILFTSDNQDYRPRVVKTIDIEVIYRIVAFYSVSI